MEKVLITGSSGMLGIDLCQELKSDYDVIGLDLFRPPKLKAQNSRAGFLPAGRQVSLPYIKCDITDRKRVAAIIAKARPDVVIHSAAWTDVDGCELASKKAYKINSEGTRNVALACKEAGSTLVYISTDFVFNGKKKTPYKESDRTAPLSVYGDSKLQGENFIKRTLSKYFILRTSWLYGRHGKNFVDTIVAKGKSESSLRVVRDQVGSPTYTKHLARAVHRFLDKFSIDHRPQTTDRRPNTIDYRPSTIDYGVYHVSNTGQVSWYDYAREILKLSGLKTKVIPITSEELSRPAKRPAMSVMDNSKFIKFTGYRMPGWKVALKEYLAK